MRSAEYIHHLSKTSSESGETMKTSKSVAAALLVSALMIVLPGCDQGPLEEAGEKVDDKIDDAGDALDDATDGS